MIHNWLVACCMALIVPPIFSADDVRNPTVGAPGRIDQLVLPGSELAAKPIDEKSPMVVRVLQVYPHGDAFRYDLQFIGLEPGEFDLSVWLVRRDNGSTDDLPTIPVTIRSLLPPGQVEPNQLDSGWLPRLGGYRQVMIGAVILWCVVLAGLIFAGRKRREAQTEQVVQLTLADLLQSRISAAFSDKMPRGQYAELERMLIAFWRRRLDLESVPTDQAMAEIRQNPDSGPLLQDMEQWLHSPHPPSDQSLAQLLEPYRKISITQAEMDA